MAGLHLTTEGATTTVTFHLPVVEEGRSVLDRLAGIARDHGGTLSVDTDHAAVSVVGTGTLDAPAVASRAHRALTAAGIDPVGMVTGSLSLTLLVPHRAYAEAQRVLHREFLEPGA